VPSPLPRLTTDDVHRLVGERCFAPGTPARVGIELEWLAFEQGDRTRAVPFAAIESAVAGLGPLPGGGQ